MKPSCSGDYVSSVPGHDIHYSSTEGSSDDGGHRCTSYGLELQWPF